MTNQMIGTSLNLDAEVAELAVPGYWFTDPKIFAQERERIWYKNWQFVGREEQLANPGDYLSCTIGDEPILLTRTSSGKLRAMYNVCPHRGMRIVEGQGNCKRLQCPYHGWIYNLEGQLQAVTYPESFPDLDKSAIALPKVQVDSWCGFIFVNLDPEARPLSEFLAGVPQHLEQYSQPWEALRIANKLTYQVPYNWKILLENYIDVYHIPMVHPQTIAPDVQLPGFVSSSLSGIHLLQKYDYSVPTEPTYIAWLFPNTTILTLENFVLVWQVNPINPELTIIEKFFCQSPEQMEKFPLKIERETPLQFAKVFDEDTYVNTIMQQQVKSRAYKPIQPLAQGTEYGIFYFRKTLIEAMKLT